MHPTLENLFHRYFKEPDSSEAMRRREENHQQLNNVLKKRRRHRVLRIIDADDSMRDAWAYHAFVQGFLLAGRLCSDLTRYEGLDAELE